MFRRHLVTNAIATALLYFAFHAFVPSTPNMLQAASSVVDAVAMQSSLLGPLVYRVVQVGGGL